MHELVLKMNELVSILQCFCTPLNRLQPQSNPYPLFQNSLCTCLVLQLYTQGCFQFVYPRTFLTSSLLYTTSTYVPFCMHNSVILFPSFSFVFLTCTKFLSLFPRILCQFHFYIRTSLAVCVTNQIHLHTWVPRWHSG